MFNFLKRLRGAAAASDKPPATSRAATQKKPSRKLSASEPDSIAGRRAGKGKRSAATPAKKASTPAGTRKRGVTRRAAAVAKSTPRVQSAQGSSPGKQIGRVIHYFNKISVGIIKLTAALKVNDRIRILGARDDFTQVVTTMQMNHHDIKTAAKGKEVGIKVMQPVHENDRVYLIDT